MRKYLFSLTAAILVMALCGCGGGSGTGSMMLKITDPDSGATVHGNQTITSTMLNPAMATKVNFKVNGVAFDSVSPGAIMTSRLDSLSLGLPNGSATVTVQSTPNVYTATENINISNGRSLFVQDVSGNANSSVTLHVRLNDFSGVAGYHIVLNYDQTKVQLSTASVAAGAGVPLDSTFTKNAVGNGVIDVTVTGTSALTSGDLLTATFLIFGSSPSGAHNNIAVATGTLTNTSGGGVAVTDVDGQITTN